MPKRKAQNKDSTLFDFMEDSFLTDLATYYPDQLKQLCILATLDIQIIEEQTSYDDKRKIQTSKKTSKRG